MNPIETLKDGIVNASWEKVCEAYQTLTGEKISIECRDVVLIDYVVIEKCVRELTEILEKKDWVSENIDLKPTAAIEDEITNVEKSAKVNKKTVHGFNTVVIDEARPSDEQIELNKLFRDKYHPKHSRRHASLYNVVCSLCDRKFKSSDRPRGDIGQQCSECLSQKTLR